MITTLGLPRLSDAQISCVKSVIAKCLGAIWILDGLLQFQPRMFGHYFVEQVLVPNLAGQPSFLQSIVTFGIYLWNFNPLVFDVGAGILQVVIGTLLLFPLSSAFFTAGTWISVLWGIIVWVFGEGAGLLLTSTATFYSGAPGAILLYPLLAILLLRPGSAGIELLPRIAAVLLIVAGVLQLQPMFWTQSGIQASLTASTTEPFHILSAAPKYFVHLLSLDPILGNTILVLIPLAIGVMFLLKPNQIMGYIVLAFLFLVWWWGQDFGMLTTLISGTATDPDTAPLLALFVIPCFCVSILGRIFADAKLPSVE